MPRRNPCCCATCCCATTTVIAERVAKIVATPRSALLRGELLGGASPRLAPAPPCALLRGELRGGASQHLAPALRGALLRGELRARWGTSAIERKSIAHKGRPTSYIILWTALLRHHEADGQVSGAGPRK
jgi:hypothetical protein